MPETCRENVDPASYLIVYDESRRFAKAMAMAYHRYHARGQPQIAETGQYPGAVAPRPGALHKPQGRPGPRIGHVRKTQDTPIKTPNTLRNIHLERLESEAIYIMRETAAQFERPCLMFSGGKDSLVMAHLARKAFWPAPVPFPLLHVDTGHNFPETLELRDRLVKDIGAELIVRTVQESIDRGRVREEEGPNTSRNMLQITTLLDALKELEVDGALGGARRDEEKARAKERFFSHRDSFGQWDPRNQRPELWRIFNGRKRPGEHFRIFPLSNWTELDIWGYILMENIEIPCIYFAHEREIVDRNGVLLAKCDYISLLDGERWEQETIRFRTVGDMTCTGAIRSTAATLEEIIEEVASARVTERGARADDMRSEAAMEDRKKQGYF